ncbi:MAG: NgoFVII family restriction endonuclease [Bacteroidetes bacterium]|nr:NgoFVII family restriction endonuclease [Bacteroidota bacterium]
MKYDIINNLDTSNHKSVVESHLENCDEFIIISPFLSSDFNYFSFNKYVKHLKKIVLITTLKQNINDQLNKISFFDELLLFGHKNNIKIEILIDNSLHAKIYLFKNGSNYNSGIITSANFTRNGLLKNNEWGVLIDDANILESVGSRILSNIVFEKIVHLFFTFRTKTKRFMNYTFFNFL